MNSMEVTDVDEVLPVPWRQGAVTRDGLQRRASQKGLKVALKLF